MTQPQDIAERALALSKADQCIIISDELSSVNLRWADNSLISNGVSNGNRLTVVAISHGPNGCVAGVASGSGLAANSVEPLLRRAEEAADAGVPTDDAEPMIDSDHCSATWVEPPAQTCIDRFMNLAPALAEAFSESKREGRRLYGYAQHTAQSTYIASSTGLRLCHHQPRGQIEIISKSRDLSDSTWVGAATSDFSDVDVAKLNLELSRRASWMKRKVNLPPGRYETLLPPSAVADLMLQLYFAATARDARDGRTVFSKPGGGTRIGECLSPLPLTLRSNPAEARIPCAPFTIARQSGNGLSVYDTGGPLRATNWIENGRLANLIETRHSASVSQAAPTPRIDNLIMESSEATSSLANMIENTKRGLLATSLWYMREIDPRTLLLTGLTRDGVYLVEDGQITAAVNNFRFNESPVGLLKRVSEVGPTEHAPAREADDFFTQTAMPPMRVADFNMSTVSESK